MDENQRVQEALASGFTIEDIRAAYLADGKELPSSIKLSEAETTGKGLSKGARLGMTACKGQLLALLMNFLVLLVVQKHQFKVNLHLKVTHKHETFIVLVLKATKKNSLLVVQQPKAQHLCLQVC